MEGVRPSAGGEAGRGGVEDAARPDGGGGGKEGATRSSVCEERRTDGAAPEEPAGQVVVMGPVPELEVARDEGAAAEPAAMLAVVLVQAVVEPA